MLSLCDNVMLRDTARVCVYVWGLLGLKNGRQKQAESPICTRRSPMCPRGIRDTSASCHDHLRVCIHG